MASLEDMRVQTAEDAAAASDFRVERSAATADFGVPSTLSSQSFAVEQVLGTDLKGAFDAAQGMAAGVQGLKGAGDTLSAIGDEGLRVSGAARAVKDEAAGALKSWLKQRPEAAWRFIKEQTRTEWDPDGNPSAAGETTGDIADAVNKAEDAPFAFGRARKALHSAAAGRLSQWDNLALRQENKAARIQKKIDKRAARGKDSKIRKFQARLHQSKAARLRGEAGGVRGTVMRFRRKKNAAQAAATKKKAFYALIPVAVVPLLLILVIIAGGAVIPAIGGILGQSGSSGSLQGNEAIVAAFFRSKGLDNVHIAAIMGNIKNEGGFENPGRIEQAALESGIVTEDATDEQLIALGGGENDPAVGIGLCQWSRGRRVNLVTYGKSVGTGWRDINVQLDFFWDHDAWQTEWTGYVGDTVYSKSKFLATDDISEATRQFCYGWERPAAASAHIDKRIADACEYLVALTSSGSSGGQDYASAGEMQKKVVDAATSGNMFGQGTNSCEGWVEQVYRSVGLSVSNMCCAHAAGDAWVVSPSRTGIPVGAAVFAPNSVGPVICNCGRDAGHVAIYIGDGKCIGNEGGKAVERTVDQFIEIYGWLGWGWVGGHELS